MDKELPGRRQQLEVIRSQKYLTLAMCDENQPYQAALNYAFSEADNCFFVHCADEGRKLGILRANPRVWGMIVHDRGPVAGKDGGSCTHSYRSVMFQGTASFVHAHEDKLRALDMLIDQIAVDGSAAKQRMRSSPSLAKLVILRIGIEALSGKESPPPKRA